MSTPDPAVVDAVTVGTMCEVLLEGEPRQLRVYVRDTGAVLGAITERWSELYGCIVEGFRYEAKVLAVTPAVRVHVQLRSNYQLELPFAAHLEPSRPAVWAAGVSYQLVLGVDRKVIATDGVDPVGTIPEEPAALPDAIELKRATAAVVTDPATGAVEVRKG